MINTENPGKLPLIALMGGWALFLLLSFIFMPFFAWTTGAGLISVVARVLILISLVYGYRRFTSEEKQTDSRFYDSWRLYVGYGIILTYVFSILPRVVVDFYQVDRGTSVWYVVWTILTTAWPAALWLVMGRDTTCLNWGFSEKELARRKEINKDKKKKKEWQKQKKSERSLWGNIWAEWIEPLVGAVLWVLVINHFIFQLYQIPSESMFPTFHTGDRVLVGKSLYAPNVPLTDYKLPRVRKPHVGDIIVFTNPKMEDPESEYYYNSVFSRVFKTFVYMITLTNVDIDKKADGQPKESMLVKRYIAGEGEKISLLNDKVWKKTADSDWTLMEEIEGEQEYGQIGLFLDDDPKLERQFETPETRDLYLAAADRVGASSFGELNQSYKEAREEFLGIYAERGGKALPDGMDEYLGNTDPMSNKQNLYNFSTYLYKRERLMDLSPQDREYLYTNWALLMGNYGSTVMYEEIYSLTLYLENEKADPGYMAGELSHESVQRSGGSPYEAFMVKANLLYKTAKLELYNGLARGEIDLSSPDLTAEYVKALTELSVYFRGVGVFMPFDKANFPEYPAEEGTFLAAGDHFLLGDNRYDSIDSRLGEEYSLIFVDSLDESDFAARAMQSWYPHPIPLHLIHGRLRFLLFPFNRVSMF